KQMAELDSNNIQPDSQPQPSSSSSSSGETPAPSAAQSCSPSLIFAASPPTNIARHVPGARSSSPFVVQLQSTSSRSSSSAGAPPASRLVSRYQSFSIVVCYVFFFFC